MLAGFWTPAVQPSTSRVATLGRPCGVRRAHRMGIRDRHSASQVALRCAALLGQGLEAASSVSAACANRFV